MNNIGLFCPNACRQTEAYPHGVSIMAEFWGLCYSQLQCQIPVCGLEVLLVQGHSQFRNQVLHLGTVTWQQQWDQTVLFYCSRTDTDSRIFL